jgi:antitoxin ParD1/3/4
VQAICLLSNAFSRSVVGFITTEVYLIPAIEKLSIALPAEMAALVRRAVDGGEYSSNNEVIRDALRDWTHKRNLREQGLFDLRKRWLEAVADNSEGLDPGPVFDRFEDKHDGLGGKTGR